MVRKTIKRSASARKVAMYKKPTPRYECYRWCTSIVGVNFDGSSNISAILINSTNLAINAEYLALVANYRTANIIKASCTFMPNLSVLNSTSQTAYTGPLMIAPYHGLFDGSVLTNGRVGVMPQTKYYNIGSTFNPIVNWYNQNEEDFDTASALSGRTLDNTYGGFLIWCDGQGYTSGFYAGSAVIRWKIGFKNPKYVS